MPPMDALVIGLVGGGLIVYGVIKRRQRRRSDPGNPNRLLAEVETPDPIARQEGNLAIGMGLLILLGAVVSA